MIPVIYRPSPFHEATEKRLFRQGSSLADIVSELGPAVAVVRIAGEMVPPAWYPRVRPKAGTVVEVQGLPGLGGFGTILPRDTTAMALNIISILGFSLAGSAIGGPVGAVLGPLGGLAGMLVTNALLPPAPLGLDDAGYSIQGSRNRLRPYEPIPRVYGRLRVYPDLAAPPFTEIVGDNQYLRLLFCVGHGPLKLSDFRIGNTAVDLFEGVDYEPFEGRPGDLYREAHPSTVIEQALNIALTAEPKEVRSGLAQAGGASTITLDTGASTRDGAYTGMDVEIVGGTGAGQTKSITAYDGATRVATVDTAWSTPPDNTSQFVIEDPEGWVYQVTEPDTDEISLDISFLQGLQYSRGTDDTVPVPVEFAIEYRAKAVSGSGPDETLQTRWRPLSFPDALKPNDPDEFGASPLDWIEDNLEEAVTWLGNLRDDIEGIPEIEQYLPTAGITFITGALERWIGRIGTWRENSQVYERTPATWDTLVNTLEDILAAIAGWSDTTWPGRSEAVILSIDDLLENLPHIMSLVELNRFIQTGDFADAAEALENVGPLARFFLNRQGIDTLIGGAPLAVVVRSGELAQAGTTDTITLDAGASDEDGAYYDMLVALTAGTGSGQVRRITDYVGATRVATVDSNWTTPPDATSEFEITDRDTFLISDNSAGIVRRSFTWRPGLGPGIYEVRIRRITPDDRQDQLSGDLKDASTLTAFRSIKRDKPPVTRDGLALVAMRIKASDQLSGIIEQFNCLAESYVPVWDGAAWSEQLTRNPAWHYADVLRNAIAPPVVSDAQIDLAGIKAWADALDAEEFLNDEPVHTGTAQGGGASTITLDTGASATDDTYNGDKVAITDGTGAGQVRTIADYVGSTRVATVSEAWDTAPDATSAFRILTIEKTGRTFDARFDKDLTKFEMLRTIAAAGRAGFAMPAGQYGVVRDVPQTVPAQHFAPRNSYDFRWTRLFEELPHAVKIEYADGDSDFRINEEIVYRDGYGLEASSGIETATHFETLELPGVTDRWQAYKDGRYFLDQAQLRPETFEFRCDFEHLACERGDLIRVTYDLPLWGLGSGRIKAVQESGGEITHLTLDEPVPMEAGTTYAVRIRCQDGTSLVGDLVTEAGLQHTVELATPLAATDPQPAVGDLVLFGESGEESVELIVRQVIPDEELGARLVCVAAAPAIHTGDAVPIPPRDAQITVPPDLNPPDPPVPVIAQIVSGPDVAVLSGDGTITNALVIHLGAPTVPKGIELKYAQARIRSEFNVQDAIDAALLGNGNAVSIQRAINDYLSWGTARVSSLFDADKNQVVMSPVTPGRKYDVAARYITRAGVQGDWSDFVEHTVPAGSSDIPADLSAMKSVVSGPLNQGEVFLGDDLRVVFGDDEDFQWVYNSAQNRLELKTPGATLLQAVASLVTLLTDLTVGGNQDAARFVRISSAAGRGRVVAWQTNGINRWTFTVTNDAESGSNAGSNIDWVAYADNGASIDTVLRIIRATGGAATWNRPVVHTVSSALSLGSVTTQFSDGIGRLRELIGESLAEQSTTSQTYTQVFSQAVVVSQARSLFLVEFDAYGEAFFGGNVKFAFSTADNTDAIATGVMLLDGQWWDGVGFSRYVVQQESEYIGGAYATFRALVAAPITAGTYYINLFIRSDDAADTMYIRNMRVYGNE